MTPPRLLTDSDALTSRLLRAGKREAPPQGSRERAILAVTLMLAAPRAPTRRWRWVGLGAAMLVGLTSAEVARRGPTLGPGPGAVVDERSPMAMPAAPVRLESRAPDNLGHAEEVRALPGAPRVSPVPVPSGTPDAQASADDELEAVRRAKVALKEHDAARALAILDDHDRTFDRPAFAEEAGALRIEALRMSGAREAAVLAGAAFFERYPRSPYTQRVRSAVFDAEWAR